MDRDLALIVASTAARTGTEIGRLVMLLKDFGEGEKDEPTKLQIAAAAYEIGLIMDSVFKEFPDLKVEFEERLEKYKRPYF